MRSNLPVLHFNYISYFLIELSMNKPVYNIFQAYATDEKCDDFYRKDFNDQPDVKGILAVYELQNDRVKATNLGNFEKVSLN